MEKGSKIVQYMINVMRIEQRCQFFSFSNCEMRKKDEKYKKLTFWTLNDQCLDQKVGDVGT
jgi:hypothetical protein